MKKFIFAILISSLVLLPKEIMAITPGTIPGAKEVGVEESPIKTTQGLINVIVSIVKWVYIVFFIIATLFILLAAFNYLTAGEEPEKSKTAHRQLIYAIIAIAIALLAVGATTIVKDFLGGRSREGSNLPTCGPGVMPPCEMPPTPTTISI